MDYITDVIVIDTPKVFNAPVCQVIQSYNAPAMDFVLGFPTPVVSVRGKVALMSEVFVFDQPNRLINKGYVVVGSTVLFRVEFKTVKGIYIDPADINLNFFDNGRNIVGANVTKGELIKVSQGIYEYPFTIPDGSGQLIYEFQGQHNGIPTVCRGSFYRRWAL